MSDVFEARRDKNRLIISIPIDDMQTEEINNILAYLKLELIVRKSKMTQAQADELADEVAASWWEKNKDRIYKMIAENEQNSGR